MSNFTKFIEAVERGEGENVRRLFEREFINKKGEEGLTALHFACKSNDEVDILTFLLSEGADIEIETPSGYRLIHYAAHWGRTTVMTTLIERGCSLDCVDKEGETPLDVATINGREECVQILLSSIVKIAVGLLNENSLSKIVDIERGTTLLDQLLRYQHPRIMDEIRSKEVNEQEIEDWLSLKALRVDPQSSRLLHQCLLWRCIHHKFDDGVYNLCTAEILNTDSLFMGPSPLETAVECGSVFWAKHILQKLVQEDESWTRAAKIAKEKNLSNISMLISKRIDYLNGKKAIGFTRIHTAVVENDPDMLEFLLNNKIGKPDEVHKIFGTALSMAYSLNQVECVQILQNKNVNVNIVDKFGQSPLHVAITNGITDHCDYLVNNMSNLEARDFMNFTVLERAVMNDSEQVCDLLVKRGAKCDQYMESSFWLDINRDFAMVLKNAPVLPTTKKETVYSLCIKINRNIYPCLVGMIDQHTVNYTDGENNTILHLCAIFLLPRLCSEMILKSANVNSVNNTEGTPLNELLKHNFCVTETVTDVSIINTILQIGESLIETVNVLIDGGASLDCSIVDMATKFHNEKLLLTLIKKKEPLECVLQPQLTTWLQDKYFTMMKEVIPLLNHSLLTDWITNDLIRNILTEPDILLAKIMYDHASCDVKTTVVETILYKAASVGDKILFDSLINDKLSTNSSLEGGESLLIRLIRERNEEFIQLLLRSSNASLYLEKKNSSMKLPLHIFIECDYWDFIDQCILNTLSVNEEDNDGNSPLSLLLGKLSETNEEKKVDRLINFAKMLISKAADIYRVNKHDRTVISYCTISKIQSNIKEYFRQHQQIERPPPHMSHNEPNPSTTPVSLPSPEIAIEQSTLSFPICSICTSEPINCTLNCGHTLCITCAQNVVDCFACGTVITARIKMFL